MQNHQKNHAVQKRLTQVNLEVHRMRVAAEQLATAEFIAERDLEGFRSHLDAETPEFIRTGCLRALDQLEHKWRAWRARPFLIRSILGLLGGPRLPPHVKHRAHLHHAKDWNKLDDWGKSWRAALQIWVDTPHNLDYMQIIYFLNGVSDTRVRAFLALLFLHGVTWSEKTANERAKKDRKPSHPMLPGEAELHPGQVYDLWVRIVFGRLEKLGSEVAQSSLRARKNAGKSGETPLRLKGVERDIWKRLNALWAALESEAQSYAFAREVHHLLSFVNNWLREPLSMVQLAALCNDSGQALDVLLLQIKIKQPRVTAHERVGRGSEPRHSSAGSDAAGTIPQQKADAVSRLFIYP